jgi:hypothetical protein
MTMTNGLPWDRPSMAFDSFLEDSRRKLSSCLLDFHKVSPFRMNRGEGESLSHYYFFGVKNERD